MIHSRFRAFLPWIYVVGILLAACQRTSDFASIRNLDSRADNIICFGDSLTEGVGANSGQDYPSVLSQRLGFPVLNAGRRGDTTATALERLPRDVLNKNPRLVIVMLGGNDFLRRVPLHDTRKNLEEIVRRVQTQGAMVAIVGMKLGLFTDEYSDLFEDIATQLHALYVPQVMKGILTDNKLKSDAIHPNAAGYLLMADRIAENIKPLLAAADRKRGGRGGG